MNLDRIEEAEHELEQAIREFRGWCQDTTIPLDKRWNLFLISRLGETIDPTDFGLVRKDQGLFAYPIFTRKGDSFPIEELLKYLKESVKFKLTPQEEIIIKEYCLKKFCSSMNMHY